MGRTRNTRDALRRPQSSRGLGDAEALRVHRGEGAARAREHALLGGERRAVHLRAAGATEGVERGRGVEMGREGWR